MVRVLHFDYRAHVCALWITKLEEEVQLHPDIIYTHLPAKSGFQGFEYNKESIEQLLVDVDVLIIHGGVKSQTTIYHEWQPKFPHLRVGILAFLKGDYKDPLTNPRIKVLDYQDTRQILQYIKGTAQ